MHPSFLWPLISMAAKYMEYLMGWRENYGAEPNVHQWNPVNFCFSLTLISIGLSCSSLAATQFLSAEGGVIERHLLDLRKIKPWAFYVFLFLVGADGETYSPYSSSFSLSYLPILQYGSCFILLSLLVTKKYVSIQSHFDFSFNSSQFFWHICKFSSKLVFECQCSSVYGCEVSGWYCYLKCLLL